MESDARPGLKSFFKSRGAFKYKNYEFNTKSGVSHFDNEGVFNYLNQKPKYMLITYDKQARVYHGFVQFQAGFSQHLLTEYLKEKDKIVFKECGYPHQFIMDFIYQYGGASPSQKNYVEIGKFIIPKTVGILMPKKAVSFSCGQATIGRDGKIETKKIKTMVVEENKDEIQPEFKDSDRKRIRQNYRYDAVKRKYVQL